LEADLLGVLAGDLTRFDAGDLALDGDLALVGDLAGVFFLELVAVFLVGDLALDGDLALAGVLEEGSQEARVRTLGGQRRHDFKGTYFFGVLVGLLTLDLLVVLVGLFGSSSSSPHTFGALVSLTERLVGFPLDEVAFFFEDPFFAFPPPFSWYVNRKKQVYKSMAIPTAKGTATSTCIIWSISAIDIMFFISSKHTNDTRSSLPRSLQFNA